MLCLSHLSVCSIRTRETCPSLLTWVTVFYLFLRMLPAQIIEYYSPSGPPPPPPPPMIPSAQTAFVSPLQMPTQPPFPASAVSTYPTPPHQPSTGLLATAPPPPGPPPPPPGPPGPSSLSSSPMHGPPVAEAKRPEPAQPPISDARSDLLAAIRMGKYACRFTVCIQKRLACGSASHADFKR